MPQPAILIPYPLAPHACNLGKALQKSCPKTCSLILARVKLLKLKFHFSNPPPFLFPRPDPPYSMSRCAPIPPPWFISLRPVLPARRMPR